MDVYDLSEFFEEPTQKLRNLFNLKNNNDKGWEENNYKRAGQAFDIVNKSNQNHTAEWGDFDNDIDTMFDRIDPD